MTVGVSRTLAGLVYNSKDLVGCDRESKDKV
jgi:hypothetical protein